jgi:hypothetical protein
MSDPLRVALVVEGPTDKIVIDSAISRILNGRPYVSTQLHPEQSLAFGPLGGGWGGVFRWCRQTAKRNGGSLHSDFLFSFHDILILHLDADVSNSRYLDANIQDGFEDLPCVEPCPPARATTNRLRTVLLRWTGETQMPERTVFCIPSKSTEAWVLAALFPNDSAVQSGNLECLQDPESRFGQQPKKRRIRKSVADYQQYNEALRQAWSTVARICTEAQRFERELSAAVNHSATPGSGTGPTE